MKKIMCLLIAASLVLAAGCTNKEATPETSPATSEGSATSTTDTSEMKDGTYSATGSGYGGEVQIEVVTQDGKITDIKLLDHNESSPVITRAFPVLRDRIIEAQTPVVDSVSGATFSSFAVKSAVATAGKEFGQDYGDITMATQGPEEPATTLDPVQTQLVIVGGGPSGLTAAISAKENGIEDVILIEKLDILSGNGKFDMNFFDMVNTQAQRENGIEDSADKFFEDKKDSGDSEARVRVWADGAANLDPWLREMGINLNYNYGERNHMAESDAYAGEHIQDHLEARVQELGVDVRTGTEGLDFVMDGDKVVGVSVQHKNESYDIMADAVIVATGGFSFNKELLAKYAPGSEDVATSNQMGATGDFVPVFEKHGMKLDKMDVLSVFKTIIVPRRDLTGGGDGFIFVNKDGKRFVDESSSGLDLAHTLLEQPDGKVFYLYDQNLYDDAYRLQKHTALGYHTKADTLEELATELGIDPTALVATVEEYNKAVNGEAKDPFREEPFDRPFNTEGPFYGVQVESAIHMTKGGVLANEKAQVLNNEEQPVEGLYASGEVTATSGAYSASVVFGRIAGQEAALYILGDSAAPADAETESETETPAEETPETEQK